MKLLIEWAIFLPYQGPHIRGGVEKQTLLMTKALVDRGHDVTLLVPRDSTCSEFPGATVLRSTVGSSETGKMKIADQLATFVELHSEFDGIYLNYPLTSQATLDEKHRCWMERSAYINHAAQGWFVTGNAGLRLNNNLRFYREMGGRAWTLNDVSWKMYEWVWTHPKKSIRCRLPTKQGSTSHWDYEIFDGKLNQMLFSDAPPVQPAGEHLIAIARTDADKKLEKTVRLAKSLKQPLQIFCTPPVTRHNQQVLEKLVKEINGDALITLNVGAPREKVLHSLATARCCLFPSISESFGLVALEAMCVGVPVLHTHHLEPLLYYPSLSREWGDISTTTLEQRQEAQDFLRQNYTMDAYGKRLEELLR